ncbi:unnamed protein product [Ambrosiozyma monospora]|uniref:Unnamed protein product n=1 Tax=Ambrosiozyma monospora TaxID=43982 RepID=A0ACB5SYE2_AMBMO|nr:unnamed protein product [Ambrosiozyma monospora]
MSYTPSHQEVIQLGANVEITALHTPCHTQDSICYFAKDKKTGQMGVFTGDTLFISGCGRFFEGTAPEMIKALGTLMKLPDKTVVYDGHEYTKSNVRFSKSVLGTQNQALNKLEEYCKTHEVTTGVFTIGDEKKFNPFVRLTDPNVKLATGVSEPTEVMAKLRSMKNNF